MVKKTQLVGIVSIAFVCFLGGALGLMLFLIRQRSEIHRISRMFKAMMIEDELTKRQIPFDTFRSCETRIHEGEVLANPEGDTRKLKWIETKVAWKLVDLWEKTFVLGWFAVGVIWLTYVLWCACKF